MTFKVLKLSKYGGDIGTVNMSEKHATCAELFIKWYGVISYLCFRCT